MMSTARTRALVVLLACVFIDLLAVALVIPLMPQYAKRVNIDPAMFGLLGAAYGTAQLIGSPFMGVLSDRVGRVFVLLVSCAGTAVSYVLIDSASTVALLFASRLVVGFVKQTITGAQAYISDCSSPEDRHKMIGRVTLASGLAFIVGPIIGGSLSVEWPRLPALSATVLLLTEFVLIWVNLPEPSSFLLAPKTLSPPLVRPKLVVPLSMMDIAPVVPATYASSPSPPATAISVKVQNILTAQYHSVLHCFTNSDLRPILWALVALNISLIMYQDIMIMALQATFSLSVQENGWVIGYLGFLSSMVQGFGVPILTKRYHDWKLLVMCLVGMALGHTLTGLAPTLTIWLVVHPLIDLSAGVAKTVLVGAATKVVANSRVGATLGVIGSLVSVCRVVSPLMAGILMKNLGTRSVDAAIAIMSVCLAVFVQLYLVHPHALSSKTGSSSNSCSSSSSNGSTSSL